MASPDARLTLLAFPQSWDGANIRLRVLALPKGNPREPLWPGAPAFADAKLALEVVFISGLESLPIPGLANAREPLALEAPDEKHALFEEMESLFNIKLPPAVQDLRPPGTQILKFLTPSYRQSFAFDGPRTQYAVTDDRYKCALTETNLAGRQPRPPLTDEITWGQLIAFAVKNPLLARKLGLLYEDLIVPASSVTEAGGFLYVTLAAGSDYVMDVAANSKLLEVYAARIPPLPEPRALFAALLFPVLAAPPGNYDELFIEAESYDDGFAKIVHGAQPRTSGIADLDATAPLPVKDIGVRLGWDDEQVAIWLNRRVAQGIVEDSLLGVSGYRLDVRLAGTTEWRSMMKARGTVRIGEITVGVFEGELAIQTIPVQLLGEKTGDFWLPSFFTSWAGWSVVIRDRAAFEITNQHQVLAGRDMQPVDDDLVPLRYGKEYEFRVRLKDLSGGGPGSDRDTRNPAPMPIARIPFRRFAPPNVPSAKVENSQLVIERPRLGYPDLVFTDFPDPIGALLADSVVALQEQREPAVHDPDVTSVEIAVEVRTLDGDERQVDNKTTYLRLYTTLRDFDLNAPPSSPLDLNLQFVDVADISAMQPVDPMRPLLGSGPLRLPTARDVRLIIRSSGKPDPQLTYFGSESARISQLSTRLDVREPATTERELFVPAAAGEQIQAIFMQPSPVPTSHLGTQLAMEGRENEESAGIAQRLAQHLELDVSGLTFSGRAGRRTVLGCSAALAHSLAPARSSITFASEVDLTRQWIIAIRVQINRDWTWDGVSPRSFEVLRGSGEVAGVIQMPRSVTALALPGAERSKTDLVFFDAFDGKPEAGQHPAESIRDYELRPVFAAGAPEADPNPSWSLRLPITTPPRQTPKLVAAGLALSPYHVADDYSSTERRERMLWLEFEAEPDDPGDIYCARVLGYAPDPMLLRAGEDVPTPREPLLPIDPEPIRVITPAQPADRSGADAMQPLTPATTRDERRPVRHYLVPLPPGLESSSLALFGFFVYELRLAHTPDRWSTAQARFGPPLRVTGVQHPAPPLSCVATHIPGVIIVSAPFATPVLNGRNVRPHHPNTDIWALIYAQVTQVDGASRRNILVGRALAGPEHTNQDQRYGSVREQHAVTHFDSGAIKSTLHMIGLPEDSPLSAMAVEVYRGAADHQDPLGNDLGQVRILRTSTLVCVPPMCVPG